MAGLPVSHQTIAHWARIIRRVTHDHDGTAGVYAAVLVEGIVRARDR